MGATIEPRGITEAQEEAFFADGFQVVGHFTYGTIYRALGVAGIEVTSEDYMGTIVPTAELVTYLRSVADRNPEDRAFGVVANCFTAAQMMGVDVVWS